ncbi:MAG: 40S ribosomal protein [Watsoniomyces obsoletus]|nr:MAG: 40S ribosomal protein [Watsoniomyces obsoletus]
MADPEEEILEGQLPEEETAELDVSVTMIEATEVIETQTTKVTQNEPGEDPVNGSTANNEGGTADDIDAMEVEEVPRKMTFTDPLFVPQYPSRSPSPTPCNCDHPEERLRGMGEYLDAQLDDNFNQDLITHEIKEEENHGESDGEEQELTPTSYLQSSWVRVIVGHGQRVKRLGVHRALLMQSPYFAEILGDGELDDGVAEVNCLEENLDAVSNVFQYLYTGDYFPRKLSDTGSLEADPSIPEPDNTGEVLLRHARVYTLAGKWGVPELQALAHSKIHRINSTAKGEIAYARYVYANTPRSDVTIRKPIAAFWAHRSHVLRHEAEDDFRTMCLDFPEFGFDVLSLVLDAKEKGKDREHVGSSRKRARTSTAA